MHFNQRWSHLQEQQLIRPSIKMEVGGGEGGGAGYTAHGCRDRLISTHRGHGDAVKFSWFVCIEDG